MKKINCFIIVSLLFICSSCSTWYEMSIISRGATPSNTTYCVLPVNSLNIDYLEFNEYAETLKNQLSQLGYTEEQHNPELKIYLQYTVGEKFVIGSISSTNNYQNTKSNLSGNTSKTSSESNSAMAVVNSSANLATISGSGDKTKTSNSTSNYKSNTYSYGGSSTTTSERYGFPLDVSIEAVSSDTNKPVWKVSVEYFLAHTKDVPNAMPWIFFCARHYIGHRYSGLICIYPNKFKDENLGWCPDNSSLQHDYFGLFGADIKSEKDFIENIRYKKDL